MVLSIRFHGSDVHEITYRDISYCQDNESLFHENQTELEVRALVRRWAFDADIEMFLLFSKAYHIRNISISDNKRACAILIPTSMHS